MHSVATRWDRLGFRVAVLEVIGPLAAEDTAWFSTVSKGLSGAMATTMTT